MIALLLALQLWQYDNGAFGGLPAYIVETRPANCPPYGRPVGQIVTSTSLPWDNPQYIHRFCFGPGSASDPTPLGRP